MSRHMSPLERSLAGFTAAALVISQISFPPQAEASHLGSSTASAGSVPPPSVSAIQSFQPDLFTGRATTSIPIAVPPGRKGVQPGLALTYSSSARNSWVGVGWNLETGYIERSTKNGVPKYDSTDTFTFMFQGVASDLVKIPDGTYRAKDEGSFLRFESLGVSGWEVRDKSGTRYLFGQTTTSQIESLGKVFRWGLDKVIDLNGNTVTFSYTKDQGQLYLSQILYTGHEPTSKAPANRVDFITESRPDVEISYRAGFEIRTAKRLKTIEAKATVGGSLQLARRYELVYAQSARTGRSELSNITQIGTDGVTALPPMTLSYQDNTSPTYTMSSNNPSVSTAAWNLRKAGLDTGHENFGCVTPSNGLPWSPSVVVTSSANLGCVAGAVGSNGSITVNGCQDHFMHAWTSVYVGSPKTISISYSGAEACTYLEAGAGPQLVGASPSVSIPLQAGWSIIHLTGYHQHEGWTNTMSTGIKNLVDIMSASQFLRPQLSGDADGNGTSDLIAFDAITGTWTVSFGRDGSFSPSTAWLAGFGGVSSTPLLGDWNADGKTDIGIYASGAWQFATSTGTGFQVGTVSSLTFGSGTPLTGDFNGDGTMDVGAFNNGSWQVALGTGTSFASTGSFSRTLGSSSSTPLTGDFNGDGLTDIGIAQSGTVTVALSNGAGFVADAAWITGFGTGNYTSADFNGDGLTDVAFYDKPAGQVRVAFSMGTQLGTPVTLPMTFSLRGTDDQLQVGDFNGDGLADPAVFNAVTGASELSNSQGTFPDLLSSIANGIGGTTTLEYRPSTTSGGIAQLPFVLPLTVTVTANDGLGHDYTTNYTYEQGLYDAPTKEFRGFAKATARDGDNNLAITEFHQDAQKKGRPFRNQFQDQAGNLWTKTEQTWSATQPYAGVFFVKLDRTDAYTYDGDTTFKQVRGRFEYDAYGNVTATYEDGEPSVSGDERSAHATFTYNASAWIVNTPAAVQTLDATGAVVAQRRFYYDNATSTATPPTTGKLTKEEEWRNLPSAQWLATSLTYDAYGNVLTVTDALNRTITNTYDTEKTYLTSITNALGHSRQLVYDPRLGQVTSSTDQNNVTATTQYDALGRTTKVIGPNDTSALPTVTYEYNLSAVPAKTTTHTRIQSGQAAVLTAYVFTDGLGRTIQTRGPAEDPTKQVVGGAVEFNDRGQVEKQWAPYTEAISTSYVPPSVATLAPPVEYAYDPMGRLVTTTGPDGAVSSAAYDDWAVTSTDANGDQTRRTNDVYGRLAKVEEFNAGQTYTTTYAYNALGNLTTVTDHAGNVTTIAYDSLGRKLSMTDPDMGAWSYAYDTVDNLTSQTDARGVIITYAYDALNRPTQKTYAIPGGSGVASPGTVTYSYDSAAQLYAKGKLTGITDGSGSSAFEYDRLGRLIEESKTVDGITYTIQRTYDLLGRLTALTYPDTETATYTYNAQGGVETVTLGAQAIMTDLTYNAAGQVTKIVYGNGVVTDYTYNPQTLRLSDLVTIGPGGTLQDFSYTLDPAGNVTQIQDAVHTGTQNFTYDDLDRLTVAVGSYGSQAYAYDPLGNLTNKEGVGMTYGAGAAGPHAVTGLSDGTTLSYDANGNLLNKVKTGETIASYAWDTENRLTQVEQVPDQASAAVELVPGWNFFALPADPADRSILTVLGAAASSVAQISRYNTGSDTWSHWVHDPEFDEFAEFEPGVGYQVYCTSAVTVQVTGQAITFTKPLAAGWHLLGATEASGPQSLATWLTGMSYSQVKALADATGTLAAATQAEPGKGYWVQVSSASTWMPPEPAVQTTQFVYDGDGGRVKQTTVDGTTIYLGESYEKAPDGITTKSVFAGSQRVATKLSTGELRFYHTDHLGSSNIITNAAGQQVELNENTPFGSTSRHEGTTDVAHKFTGQRQDAGTGLVLFPGRPYDPELGRFLQPDPFVQDPADPQFLNRYSYVRNNPINLVDPDGYTTADLLAPIAYYGSQAFFFLLGVGAIAGAAFGLFKLFGGGGGCGTFNCDFDPSILQDTGERFWQSLPSLTSVSGPQESSMAGWLVETGGAGQGIADPVAFVKQHNLSRLSIFVNGVRTSEEDARKQALRHALTVFYNPSIGAISDFSEAASQLTEPTEVDLELVRILNQLAEAGIPVDIVGFSQGNEVIWNAARAGAKFAPGSTVTPYSSPLSPATLRAALPGHVKLLNQHTPSTDPINFIQGADGIRHGNILGGAIQMYGGYLSARKDLLTFFRLTSHRMPRE